MKRRSFLSLSALSAVPVAARHRVQTIRQTEIRRPGRSRALSDRPLKVADRLTIDELRLLIFDLSCRRTLPLPIKNPKSTIVTRQSIPLPLKVTQVLDEKGEHRCYQYKGKDQPYPFRPGVNLVKRFDLTWDGKAMQIPERFWNDLPDLRIATSTLNPETLNPEIRWKAERFLENLRQPHVSLSAEGGTVLIEWERGEECDSSSTIRWIVSKSGTVLRHRHCPPHEC